MKISIICIDVSVDIDVTATAAAQFDWMDAFVLSIQLSKKKRQILVLVKICLPEGKRRRTTNEEPHRFLESTLESSLNA